MQVAFGTLGMVDVSAFEFRVLEFLHLKGRGLHISHVDPGTCGAHDHTCMGVVGKG